MAAKPDPQALYRCLDSFVMSIGGADSVIKEDMNLLGSHPAVVAHPDLFIKVGTDDLAIFEAKSKRLNAAIAAVLARDPQMRDRANRAVIATGGSRK